MNALVFISEENSSYTWLPNPTEQFEQPPPNAICWVSGNNDEELLAAAKQKFTGLGFEVIKAEFYAPGTLSIKINLTVKERTDVTQIQIGSSHLSRVDTSKGVMH